MTDSVSRRTFMHTTAAATAAFAMHGGVRVWGSDVIRVGVIGCGGRGTGAALDCMRGSRGMELVALGDLMPDRVAKCRAELEQAAAKSPEFAANYKVTDERCFTGFDAYKKVLESDIHLVILATPPGFRPAASCGGRRGRQAHLHGEARRRRSRRHSLRAGDIRAGEAEGPWHWRRHAAPASAGIRRDHPAHQRRRHRRRRERSGVLEPGRPLEQRAPADWTDTEWQIRNWLYFTWLSGDHIVEQHVHNIDVANWVLGAHPIKAIGVGGRQQRTDPKYGHIYDHFAIDFEYPNGARVVSMCRQIEGTRNRVGEHFIGIEGRSRTRLARSSGTSRGSTRSPEKRVNPYVQEHTDLVASIRAGKPINELKEVADSTLTAIMGREAAYTGQEITWDEILNAELDLTPPTVAFGPLEVPPVAMPGKTKLNRKWNA